MERERATAPQLMIDFITSLDGYASGVGWPGWWGLEGPEYLQWMQDQPEQDDTILMGAATYRMMSGFVAAAPEEDAMADLTSRQKIVFSSSLDEPLAWANSRLITTDAVEAVRQLKSEGGTSLRTIGSLALCASLLRAGLVDRFRVVVFPVITGETGRERIYDGYPDVALELIESRTFDGRIQLLDYIPTLIDGPPGAAEHG
jgi:dihydrofolate reductase